MRDVILTRGLLAPFTHIVWTAMAAGALGAVKGNAPFKWAQGGGVEVPAGVRGRGPAAHDLGCARWDWTGEILPDLLAGAAGWFMVASLIQEGLSGNPVSPNPIRNDRRCPSGASARRTMMVQ